MRLAFIDPVFSWPPLGGAPLDLYYTMSGLQALGHEVSLYYAQEPQNWVVEPPKTEELLFEATAITFRPGEYTPETAPRRFRDAIEPWKPDIIFQCFGFFMKPFLTEAFADYPQVARYYAYEPICPRDYRIYKDFGTCPYNYLETPNICRRCTAMQMWREIRTGRPNSYVQEYEATRAYSKSYYQTMIRSLERYRAVIVYNHFTKDKLAKVTDRVHVIGGGVKLEDFIYTPLPEQPANEKTIILMTGRADDYSKGMSSLQEAGEILARERDDFEIWVTHPEASLETHNFKPIGWHPFSRIMEFYKQADICVVPSKWEEPFGLVAVEAMAIGRPTVVSDVGGLQEIVEHGKTGYVYPREDAGKLAEHLRTLLDDRALLRSMGEAARKRVEELYDWKRVIERHYPPLLEEVMS